MDIAAVASASIIPLRNDKRERKHTAQTLPPGISHNMMKKYVVYYREIMYLQNGKTQPREYFKVESHPSLVKPWVSSKSMKISLLEKLKDANRVVADLEHTQMGLVANTDEPNKEEDVCAIIERYNKKLPKYTTIRIVKDTQEMTTLTFIYDRKDNTNGYRWTCSHTFTVPKNEAVMKTEITAETISLGISNLKEKLYDKYGVDLLHEP
jgi:hypothetical protein